LAILFTFTRVTIIKTNGTKYATAQPIILIPDIVIGKLLCPACLGEITFISIVQLMHSVDGHGHRFLSFPLWMRWLLHDCTPGGCASRKAFGIFYDRVKHCSKRYAQAAG